MRDMSIADLLAYAEKGKVRISNAIEKYNSYEFNKHKIKTVGDLVFLSHLTPYKMENMGKKSINNLCNALRRAAFENGYLSSGQLENAGDIKDLWSFLRENLKGDSFEVMQQHVARLKQELATTKLDYLRVAKQLEGLTERYDELIQSQNQQTTLDQFAMSALSQLINHRHLTCIDAAAAAYNYAKAMQAESQKRQGGDV